MKNENDLLDEPLDTILENKREELIVTISFLKALKENLDPNTAFNIACKAFANYMIKVYSKVLGSTKPYSQERFDKFREFYEEHAKNTPYLKIIESNPNFLSVRFERCPFYEILIENDIQELGFSFCLSDLAFTKKLLPGVKFSRTSEIAKGGAYCDNNWEYKSIK